MQIAYARLALGRLAPPSARNGGFPGDAGGPSAHYAGGPCAKWGKRRQARPQHVRIALVANLCMLAVMMVAVVLCSFVASLIPGRPVPEVVFFVLAGIVVGPHCLGIVHSTPGLDLVSRLGMGFLFLMAGYELDLRELTGKMGRHASVCWAASFAAALIVTPMLGLRLDQTGCAAFAIALTTTAYGTLVPIMRDRELAGTSVGEVIESYGAMGEILSLIHI